MDYKKLIENSVHHRNMMSEEAKIVKKWERMGLLEGLEDTDRSRSKTNMARLLENQIIPIMQMAKMNETTQMAGGAIQGFTATMFPLVRRIFGDLFAEKLVTVQTMNLPHGLIFYLDFIRMDDSSTASVYGQGVVGSEIINGVSLTGANAETGFYNMGGGYYSSPTGSASVNLTGALLVASGTVGAGSATLDAYVAFDPDLSGSNVVVYSLPVADFSQFDARHYVAIRDTTSATSEGAVLLKRHTRIHPTDSTKITVVYSGSVLYTGAAGNVTGSLTGAARTYKFPIKDDFVAATALGAVKGDPTWGFEFGVYGDNGYNSKIPELNMKMDSTEITTKTKKLKVKWTMEASQDVNAYQGLDVEVELTAIMAEQIKREIDAEILEELVKGATAAKLYWSTLPGKFVSPTTGATLSGASFTGNVSEWKETLLHVIERVGANIHRKTLRGGATDLVCGPELAGLLKTINSFRSDITVEDGGDVGVTKEGTLGNKLTVHSTAYFPRNIILVVRKGSSWLETGFVYAPYIPLLMTNVVQDPDFFQPTKGVMTRYGKKMVRPDFYGLVIVQDLGNLA